MGNAGEMALLRTTDCAALFPPPPPPLSVLVDNIQNFAFGEADLVGVIWGRDIYGTSSDQKRK